MILRLWIGRQRQLTGIPKTSRCRIAIAPDDLALIAGHGDDAGIAEAHQRAVVLVPGRTRDLEAHVLPVLVAPQVVAPVDEGGAHGERVAGLRGERAAVGQEGDVEEVVGDGERGVDVNLRGGRDLDVSEQSFR